MTRPALLVILLLTVVSGGCSRPHIHHATILQFGTLIEVTLVSDDPEKARLAIDMLEADFATMQQQWQVWKPGPLMELNQAIAHGKPHRAAPSLLPLIETATQLSRASGGLFNPAAGKLIALWGFHQDDFGRTREPLGEEIEQLVRSNPTMDDLHISNGIVQSRNPDVKLDFGGVAKGYALAIEAKKLQQMGIDDFIINAGGDLVAYGNPPRRLWRIGVRKAGGDGSLGSIEPTSGEAIFTSGDYERYYNSKAGKRQHIIDPRSGYPADQAHAVTIIHHDPAVADAAATALMIAKPEERVLIAKSLGIDTFLVVGSHGDLLMTTKMKARIQLAPGIPQPQLITMPAIEKQAEEALHQASPRPQDRL